MHKTGRLKFIADAAALYPRDGHRHGAHSDAAAKIPHEDIRYLSRDEIAGFGIDRREFAETPWFSHGVPTVRPYVSKWIVEASGPERKDIVSALVMMGCGQQQHVAIQYMRGLASDEVARTRQRDGFDRRAERSILSMSGYPSKHDAIDTGAVFASAAALLPFAAFESLAAAAAAGSVESDRGFTRSPPRVIKLSTQRLGEGIKALGEKCAPSAQPASWVDGTQVPFVPAQKGSPAVPAAPYGAYPVPELGLGTGAGKKK